MAQMLTDTSDMLAVHQVFRKALGRAPDLVGSVSGDEARRQMVANFYDNLLRFLHAHHSGEEVLIWPKLSERCPDQGDTMSRAVAQHADVVGLAQQAADATSSWGAAAGGDGAALVAALGRLDEGLTAHLDEEETVILPLCAEHVTQEEWGELPGHGLRHFDGDKVWLILGLIRENMTQEQRDAMLAHMPPPAVEMWTSMGESSFNALIGELRGSGGA